MPREGDEGIEGGTVRRWEGERTGEERATKEKMERRGWRDERRPRGNKLRREFTHSDKV